MTELRSASAQFIFTAARTVPRCGDFGFYGFPCEDGGGVRTRCTPLVALSQQPFMFCSTLCTTPIRDARYFQGSLRHLQDGKFFSQHGNEARQRGAPARVISSAISGISIGALTAKECHVSTVGRFFFSRLLKNMHTFHPFGRAGTCRKESVTPGGLATVPQVSFTQPTIPFFFYNLYCYCLKKGQSQSVCSTENDKRLEKRQGVV